MVNQGRAYLGKHSIHDPIDGSAEEIETRDILGRRQLAGRILKRLDEADCPRVVGVYGGWGTGKTSLKNMLVHQNGGIDGRAFRILDIDAWKYESSDGLLIPVIVNLKQLAGGGDLPGVWKSIIRRILATTGLTLTDILLNKAGIDRQQIKETYQEVENHDEDKSHVAILRMWEKQISEIDATEMAFKELVESAVQTQGGRQILICVDNLDRCSPENVVKLLESVKVFFNAPGCTWLFAVDSEVVAGYINKRYQDTGVDGYSYLDKIIPEQYHLSLSPASDRQSIENLLRYAIGKEQFNIDVEKIPQIPKILVPRRLIKSARKFADFYSGRFAARGVPPETVMSLCLLYHTWPGFYQRLSSASEEHVRRILDNFFPEEARTGDSPKKYIPLSEAFLKDSELAYFIRTAFEGIRPDASIRHLREIVEGLSGLREGGLP